MSEEQGDGRTGCGRSRCGRRGVDGRRQSWSGTEPPCRAAGARRQHRAAPAAGGPGRGAPPPGALRPGDARRQSGLAGLAHLRGLPGAALLRDLGLCPGWSHPAHGSGALPGGARAAALPGLLAGAGPLPVVATSDHAVVGACCLDPAYRRHPGPLAGGARGGALLPGRGMVPGLRGLPLGGPGPLGLGGRRAPPGAGVPLVGPARCQGDLPAQPLLRCAALGTDHRLVGLQRALSGRHPATRLAPEPDRSARPGPAALAPARGGGGHPSQPGVGLAVVGRGGAGAALAGHRPAAAEPRPSAGPSGRLHLWPLPLPRAPAAGGLALGGRSGLAGPGAGAAAGGGGGGGWWAGLRRAGGQAVWSAAGLDDSGPARAAAGDLYQDPIRAGACGCVCRADRSSSLKAAAPPGCCSAGSRARPRPTRRRPPRCPPGSAAGRRPR